MKSLSSSLIFNNTMGLRGWGTIGLEIYHSKDQRIISKLIPAVLMPVQAFWCRGEEEGVNQNWIQLKYEHGTT